MPTDEQYAGLMHSVFLKLEIKNKLLEVLAINFSLNSNQKQFFFICALYF